MIDEKLTEEKLRWYKRMVHKRGTHKENLMRQQVGSRHTPDNRTKKIGECIEEFW